MVRLNIHKHFIRPNAVNKRETVRRARAAGLSALLVIVLPLLLLLVPTAAVYATSWNDGYSLEQIAKIHVPGAPSSGWCFDLGAIGPGPTYILANASQKELTVVNDRYPPTLAPPIGQGDFTGQAGCHQFNFSQMGPEGVLVWHGEIFVGNGNSHVEIFSLRTHQRLFNLATGGVNRADEMTIGHGWLAVTNPDDPVPFLSFISLRTHQIVKHIFFNGMNGVPKATHGLEQPQWFAGNFYVSVPATEQNPGGEVDVINPRTWVITSIPVTDCTPAGLAINTDGRAAVGCASGQQAILDIGAQRVIARVPVFYVDVVATLGDHFFFASYGSAPGQQPAQAPQLVVSNGEGHVLARKITTSQSHTVTVDTQNGHILVPYDGGLIFVFQEV